MVYLKKWKKNNSCLSGTKNPLKFYRSKLDESLDERFAEFGKRLEKLLLFKH